MLVGWREGWCWRGGVMLWPRGTDCTLRSAPTSSPTQPKYTNKLCPGQRLSTGSLNHHQFPSHGSWSHTTLLTSTRSHEFTLRKNPAQGWSSRKPQENWHQQDASIPTTTLYFSRCQKHSNTKTMFQKLVLMIRGSKTQTSMFETLERLPQGQQWSAQAKGCVRQDQSRTWW